jgi:hypothetical protein
MPDHRLLFTDHVPLVTHHMPRPLAAYSSLFAVFPAIQSFMAEVKWRLKLVVTRPHQRDMISFKLPLVFQPLFRSLNQS